MSSSKNLMFLMLLIIYIQFDLTAETALMKKDEAVKSENQKKNINLVRDMPETIPYLTSETNQNEKIESQMGEEPRDLADSYVHPGYTIESMTQTFTIDAKLQTCNVNVKERIKFKLDKASNILNYMIISKKTPLFGFRVKVVNPEIMAMGMNIYEDGTFRTRVFMDSEGRSLAFRDRWMISTQLSEKVKEVELEYSYNMQRAVLVDPMNEANKFKVDLINPLPFTIENHQLVINLKNFEKLSTRQFKTPIHSTITSTSEDPNRIQIVTVNPFGKHSEYGINLDLPYEIISCDGNIVNLVFYGLITMTGLFVIMSIATMSYLNKE